MIISGLTSWNHSGVDDCFFGALSTLVFRDVSSWFFFIASPASQSQLLGLFIIIILFISVLTLNAPLHS